MDHPRFGLKYVDATDFEGTASTFDGIDVDGIDGEKLGNVEGFIVDVQDGRPRHVVVSAGWFFHKHFLLPIGHVGLKDDGKKLVADLTKERVNRFPGFDKDQFETLTPDQLKQLDRTLAAACSVDEVYEDDVDDHYRTPDWWKGVSSRSA